MVKYRYKIIHITDRKPPPRRLWYILVVHSPERPLPRLVQIRDGMERVELGWISQEMREALPEAVIAVDPNNPDEHLYINDQPVIVALVAAVKEVVAELETLKAEIATKATKRTRKKAA